MVMVVVELTSCANLSGISTAVRITAQAREEIIKKIHTTKMYSITINLKAINICWFAYNFFLFFRKTVIQLTTNTKQ